MLVTFVEKNYKTAARFKTVITEKLAKLDKYFGDDVSAKVFCSKQNKVEKLEVNILSKGVLYRAEVSGNNNYDNIDLVLPKLEKQIVRSKQKVKQDRKSLGKTKKSALTYEFLEEEPIVKLGDITKTKSFELDPISVEDAKDALERTDHSFYIFLNVETGRVNVLYKRNDKQYGLIEVTF